MSATATRGQAELSSKELAGLLAADPLIGVSAAAKLIPVKPPNFKRDVAPHLTRIPVEGSADVYFRSEVEAFARAKAATRSNGHESSARDVHQPGPNVENIRSSGQAKAGVAPVPKRR